MAALLDGEYASRLVHSDPCDNWPRPWFAPDAPVEQGKDVWYRGWEIGWNEDAERWTGQGWDAYRGGVDVGAARVQASTYQACLDEIDMEEG